MLRSRKTQSRNGFTLVEILVVIAIIAILVALITPALMRIMGRGAATDNMHTIRQLEIALEEFKRKYGVYPPSKIKLCPLQKMYGPSPLDTESLAILNIIWPRLSTPQPVLTIPSFMHPISNIARGIDWSGGQPNYKTTALGSIILEGDQCLAFFLGGIPDATTPGGLGFSTNPLNPADVFPSPKNPKPEKIGPFFKFKGNRLYVREIMPGVPVPGLNRFKFYSYRDSFSDAKTPLPYVYFSGGRRPNSYNSLLTHALVPVASTPGALAARSDCATLGVWPYAQKMDPVGPKATLHTPPTYYNPDSFQIISAGADGRFGTGTMVLALDNNRIAMGAPTYTTASGLVGTPSPNLAPGPGIAVPTPLGFLGSQQRFPTWAAFWADYWPSNAWADDQTNFQADVLSARGN